MNKRCSIATLTLLVIFSLAPSGFAGNSPSPSTTQPSNLPKVEHAIDNPRVAPFKRFQGFAFKYREKLNNLETLLKQAQRVGALKPDGYKDMRKRLDAFLEAEPALARSNWDPQVLADFDKKIAKYNEDLQKGNPDVGASARKLDASLEKAAQKEEKEAAKKEEKQAATKATKDESKKGH